MDDRARVRALLGRDPRGAFEVVVRDVDGDPVVIRNAPLLDDGTPMPTRYWLVGVDAIRRVGTLEAAGGVRAAEAAVDADAIADAHRRYASERDAALPSDHAGPRPTGGVGGTRTGVKCLHAHYAWHLAGGDDPVGRWVASQLAADATPGMREQARFEIDDHETRVSLGAHGAVMPVGPENLAAAHLRSSDPPPPEALTNSIGIVADHLGDVARALPTWGDGPSDVALDGAHARVLAQIEIGSSDMPAEFVLTRDAAEDVFRTLATEPARDRAFNPGLPAEHVDTVVAAACIVVAVMRGLHLDEVTVLGAGGGRGAGATAIVLD